MFHIILLMLIDFPTENTNKYNFYKVIT